MSPLRSRVIPHTIGLPEIGVPEMNESKTLIQLAVDALDFNASVDLVAEVSPYIDIIEIGTPCIKHNGINLVHKLREDHPDKLLLVDLKTMDAGEYEAMPFYEAGADICTVLGASGIPTIAGVVKAANKHGAQAQVDMINVHFLTQFDEGSL